MDKEAAIRRIKKLAALVASDNPHESEAAARQMAAMMAQYRVEEGDLLAAEAEEFTASAGADKQPVRWECHLAKDVAEHFGCELVFSSGWFDGGQWKFIGVAPAGQLAHYAFEVLFRKCKSARRAYMADKLKRIKVQKNKTAKADLYAEGWVAAVGGNLRRAKATLNERQTAALAAFMAQKYPKLGQFTGRQNTGRESANDWQHRANGREDGASVELGRGVTTGGKPKRIGRDVP
jgi:hypothetical protein